jgi:hypothetical protein
VANQRRRKTNVHTIEGPDGAVESTEEIIEVATQYYKELFKFEPRPNIKLSEHFFSEEEKVSSDEREVLERRFSEEEIRKTVFESYSDGAPSPDGISFMFYQQLWDIIKLDLIDRFEDFFEGKLDLYRLNFALITIIPKENDARTMNKFCINLSLLLLHLCFVLHTFLIQLHGHVMKLVPNYNREREK